MRYWPDSKDPDAVADYLVDWSARLEDGETISTSSWSVVSGTVEIADSPAPSISGGTTKAWFTGGVSGEVCSIRNRITTSGGRTYDKTGNLRIRSE